MHVITGKAFEEFIAADPSWAWRLESEVEITGNCTIEKSDIRHLSPLLHFTGTYTVITRCPNLKKAEGQFNTFVDFEGSAIEEIGELKITGTDLLCDLSGTPLMRKNPLEAARAMTGSTDPNVWDEVLAKIHNTTAMLAIRNLREASKMARRENLRAKLAKPPREGGMEI
jgi:hypothetical protein